MIFEEKLEEIKKRNRVYRKNEKRNKKYSEFKY